MKCTKCPREAILFQKYSGMALCLEHFRTDFEGRCKKLIRKEHWIEHGDLTAAVFDASPASFSMIHLYSRILAERRDVSLYILDLSENENAAAFISEKYPFRVLHEAEKDTKKYAFSLTADKYALHFLQSALDGDASEALSNPISAPDGAVPVYPLMHIPDEEARLYAEICAEIPEELFRDSRQTPVEEKLAAYTKLHPAAPFSLENLKEGLSEKMRIFCNQI